jgi:two-component system cell cycle response regulator
MDIHSLADGSRVAHDRSAAPFQSSTIKSSGLFGGDSVFIPTLTFLSGDALGKELPILQSEVTLGRGEESDVLIIDPSVSRKHIRITCRKLLNRGKGQSLRVVLQDLGSKNGTMVNYRKVKRAVLKAGDKISIGRIILKFEYRDLADQKFYEEIYKLATEDRLTNLLNKATISRTLTEEISKSNRYRRRLSVVLMDIDDFKCINDSLGHLMGDRVIQSVSSILRRGLRRQDKPGRFGGEEFLLVLPETGITAAVQIAERLRQEIHGSIAGELELGRPLTCSFGLAAYRFDGSNAERLVAHADAALYRAKAKGKNRVEIWRESKANSRGTKA